MGWLKPTILSSHQASHEQTSTSKTHHSDSTKDISFKLASESAQHLETTTKPHSSSNNNNTSSQKHLPYPFQPLELLDISLPFIPATTVRSASKNLNRTWIVIDTIVYDCTAFALEHPGGETVISNFAGQDCSWQFWRFHNSTHMRDSGRPLRVGRTAGVSNRFAERPRFVGLRRKDEWSW